MAQPRDTTISSEERAFLERFEPFRRSFVSGFFHRAVRGGAAQGGDVVEAVRAAILSRLQERWLARDLRLALARLLLYLEEDPRQVRAYAGHVLAWEALPRAERERLKAERKQQYIQEWLRHQQDPIPDDVPIIPVDHRKVNALAARLLEGR